ncbi:MAG: 1-acyl-sn-glycerol-3-phosphate acyltransferase [Thermoanaerobaculia bacterium]|nr:1-acyl-sn-glycerol-3-phosphate acyltransferase [Thermoanaerobaculia bacterium]
MLATGFVYSAYAWTVLGLIALVGIPLIIVTPTLAWRRRLARSICRLMFLACAVPLQVVGLDLLPEQSNYLVVANHFSFADGLILTAALPPRHGFMIKAEVARNPVARWLLLRLGCHFVERFDKRKAATAARVARKRAQSGDALVFFAEGTFHDQPGLLPFHLGAFATAVGAGIPVVPVGIRGNRTLLRGKTGRLRWTPIAVEIATPISADSEPGRRAARLRDAVRREVLARCGEADATISAQSADSADST